jgi:hypothetical protein
MTQDSANAFKKQLVTIRVAIEPSKADLALPAVTQKLNEALFLYSDDLQGVPIAYENIRFHNGDTV